MILLAFVLVVLGTIVAVTLERTPGDGVTFASLFASLLLVIPARFVVGPLGGIATPAVLIGLGALLLWCLQRIHPPVTRIDRAPNPVRLALLLLVAFAATSGTAAHLRTLSPEEASGIGRTAFLLLAGIGIALLVSDTTPSIGRVERLVDRIVVAGAIAALYGLVQFAADVDLGSFLAAEPLLTLGQNDGSFQRSVFRRPSGPALHPIAFGVIVAAMLPLSLHRVFHRPDASALSRFVPLLLLGAAVPISLSRSAFLATLVGVGVLWISWSPERRLVAGVLGGLGLGSTVFVPGLAGTLRNLFTGTDVDPSIQSRIDRVDPVFELIGEAPLFGRGFGTYNAEAYFLLDNELYASLIEVGYVGVALYGAVVLTVCWAARAPWRLGADERTRDLAQALMGGVLAITTSVFTFDTFFYRTTTGLLLLMMGMVGAVYGHVTAGARATAPPRREAAVG